MRDKPIFSKVLSHVPQKCEDETKQRCLLNKIEILRFMAPSQSKSLTQLGLEVSRNDSRVNQQIESLFEKMTQNYTDI